MYEEMDLRTINTYRRITHTCTQRHIHTYIHAYIHAVCAYMCNFSFCINFS